MQGGYRWVRRFLLSVPVQNPRQQIQGSSVATDLTFLVNSEFQVQSKNARIEGMAHFRATHGRIQCRFLMTVQIISDDAPRARSGIRNPVSAVIGRQLLWNSEVEHVLAAASKRKTPLYTEVQMILT